MLLYVPLHYIYFYLELELQVSSQIKILQYKYIFYV